MAYQKSSISNFFICFFENLGNCLNENYKIGQLTNSQCQAVITLIQKPGKDSRQLKSWRPISLKNVDVKILRKVLVKRIQNHLQTIIGNEQSAFVAGRYIGDSIRLIDDILYYSDLDKKVGFYLQLISLLLLIP